MPAMNRSEFLPWAESADAEAVPLARAPFADLVAAAPPA